MPAQFEFQSTAKEPYELTYKHSGAPKGEKFVIPAIIPTSLLKAQELAQRERALLKSKSKKDRDEATARIGSMMIDTFVEEVIPPEMRRVLHLPDAGPIFQMWAEYVELGEG